MKRVYNYKLAIRTNVIVCAFVLLCNKRGHELIRLFAIDEYERSNRFVYLKNKNVLQNKNKLLSINF